MGLSCSLAGIVGSNPTQGNDISQCCVVRYRVLYWADHTSREVLLNVVCLECDCEGSSLLEAVMPWGEGE